MHIVTASDGTRVLVQVVTADDGAGSWCKALLQVIVQVSSAGDGAGCYCRFW